MKIGKISQAVLDRSVLRPLGRAGALPGNGPEFGMDYGVLAGTKEQQATVGVCVCGTLGGVCDRSVEMLLTEAENGLAVSGTWMKSVMLGVLFPACQEEKELKDILNRAGAWCAASGVAVAGGHTQVSGAICRPALTVNGFGSVDGPGSEKNRPRPGQELVMVGWAGMAGTVLLAKNRQGELIARYPYSIIDGARGMEGRLRIGEAVRAARNFSRTPAREPSADRAEEMAMHDISQGGVFGALWELAERGGVGLDADLRKIPIRQETIEICEFFDLNPYQLYGQGGLLVSADQGEALVEYLNGLGIPASVMGRITDGKDRILHNGQELRYLDRPAQDALWVLEERELRS